jgi:hypothetical protein
MRLYLRRRQEVAAESPVAQKVYQTTITELLAKGGCARIMRPDWEKISIFASLIREVNLLDADVIVCCNPANQAGIEIA